MNKPVFYIILVSCLFAIFVNAQQNLIPNPSFEEYTECPNAPGSVGDDQLEKATGWYKPNSATTDYYNACASYSTGVSVPNNWLGNQSGFHGAAYIGLSSLVPNDPYIAEYVQCKLIEPLKGCGIYHFSMRISLADFSTHALNTVGARFDKSPIIHSGAESFLGFELPCHICSEDFIIDTSGWIKVSGNYVSEGGEEYLTIGRFVSLPYSNENFPSIEVYPDSAFSLHDNAYYYIDSVSLIEIGQSEIFELPNVLTANNDGVNDFWYPIAHCKNSWNCLILNRWGDVVYHFGPDEPGWHGENNDNQPLKEGTYYYILQSESFDKTGFIQLVR